MAASDSGRLQPLLNVSEPVVEKELAKYVKDSRKLIDYWAMDWDCKGDTSHDQWQCFRVKKNPKVDYGVKHKYEWAGEYQIMVKVVDVFGNDMNKVVEVRVT
ncbi:MAG: hypothetical protein KAS74_00640 [Methanosarcinales archaeon]|jgi:adenine-specific DNA-methyltransferase|nr:hypothetical protein [Methanosarcinales archaeon]